MDIYKKRRICALIILIFLFIFIIASIKCCHSTKKSKGGQTGENTDSSQTEVIVPNADISDVVSAPAVTAPPEPVFSEWNDIDFVDAEFSPDDISLINKDYLKEIVIIGDSISRGYKVYKRMDDDNVIAEGSIGVRNVLETKFEYQSYSLDVLDILGRRKPKYIFISLGMNDINIHSEEIYTENYKKFIDEIFKVSPDSKIIVTAITPITYEASLQFTTNEKIDTYNEALRKMVFDLNNDSVYYINAARYLKNENNYLIDEYTSGDGIHLAPVAYDNLLSYMLMMLDWI